MLIYVHIGGQNALSIKSIDEFCEYWSKIIKFHQKIDVSTTKMPKDINRSKDEIEKIEHKKAKVNLNSQNIGSQNKWTKGERKKKGLPTIS